MFKTQSKLLTEKKGFTIGRGVNEKERLAAGVNEKKWPPDSKGRILSKDLNNSKAPTSRDIRSIPTANLVKSRKPPIKKSAKEIYDLEKDKQSNAKTFVRIAGGARTKVINNNKNLPPVKERAEFRQRESLNKAMPGGPPTTRVPPPSKPPINKQNKANDKINITRLSPTKSPSNDPSFPNNKSVKFRTAAPKVVQPGAPSLTQRSEGKTTRPSETVLVNQRASSKMEVAPPKIWNRNPITKAFLRPVKDLPVPPEEKAKKPNTFSVFIQVNELEISNPDMTTGDMKIMLPSKSLVEAIDNERHQKRLLKLLKSERTFEPHALQEKEHLTDLKEFLEKSSIKKRPRERKTVDQLEEDRRMISKMDELFRKALPKTESITDITKRIKNKEQELLNMFEGFYKLKIPGINPKSSSDDEEI